MVGRLLQAGADPNLALLSGETPLMVASRVGQPPVVVDSSSRRARTSNAARDARSDGAHVGGVAEAPGRSCKLLIAAGADIHARSAAWSQ